MLKNGIQNHGVCIRLAERIKQRVDQKKYQLTRVLILDDDQLFAEKVRKFLWEHLGIKATIINHSEKVKETFETAKRQGKPFHMFISDFNLRADDLGWAFSMHRS